VKWLGQQWEEDEKPWQGLPILVDNQVTELFEASIIISVGDSAKTSFDTILGWTSFLYVCCRLIFSLTAPCANFRLNMLWNIIGGSVT
jgi:hypothetical protein